MHRTLAIIEADGDSAAKLKGTLEAAGFRTECFEDGARALHTLRERRFALAVLGLDPAQTHAFDVCREVSSIVPVVTMTSDSTEDTCVRALQSGADDCVCRRVPERELVARVHNVLRRTGEPLEPLQLDDLTFSIREMRVRQGDTVHELTRGEAELLAVLIEHAPRPLTAVQLSTMLGAARGTIESRIKTLRRKIGPHRLLTQGRFGYHLA